MSKKIILGSDKTGYQLKEDLKKHLTEKGHEVEDIGMYPEEESRPYFESAKRLAPRIQSGEFEKGILCCGTGMGMAIVANKFKGIYASVVESSFPAKMCKIVNNANVLTLGGWLTATRQATDMVDNWLEASFTEGFPEDRQEFLKNALDEIKKIENENFK